MATNCFSHNNRRHHEENGLCLAVLALLILLGLYTVGLAHGHPRPEYSPSTVQRAWLNGSTIYHPDEFAYVGIAYRMLLNRTWNPHYYHNPPLNIYTNLAVFWLSGTQNMPHDIQYGDREIAPFQLYAMARYMSALYTLLTVALVYATGRRAFGRLAGLIAAGVIGMSLLIVQHAHYATPSAQATLLMTAVLFMAACILKDRYPLRLSMSGAYAASGLLAGLATAARYNVAVVGMVLGLAMLTAWWKHRHWFPVVSGFVMMPIGFIIGTPGIVLATSEVTGQIRDIMDYYRIRGGGPGFTANTSGAAFYYHWRYVVLFGVGPVAVIAAVVGLFATVTRGWRYHRYWSDAWFGIAFVLYMLVYTVLALRGRRIQANLLFPLLDPLALLAGYGTVWLWWRLGSKRGGLALMATALVAWPLLLSIMFDHRIAATDNRMKAQEWIYQHVPRGTRIYLLEPYNVPIDPLDYSTRQTYAGEATPEDVERSQDQVIVYSDSFPYMTLHEPSLSDSTSIAREKGIRHVLETEWKELVRFKRWYWPGQSIHPDDVSYWHQMEIVIYCKPNNCPVK